LGIIPLLIGHDLGIKNIRLLFFNWENGNLYVLMSSLKKRGAQKYVLYILALDWGLIEKSLLLL